VTFQGDSIFDTNTSSPVGVASPKIWGGQKIWGGAKCLISGQ